MNNAHINRLRCLAAGFILGLLTFADARAQEQVIQNLASEDIVSQNPHGEMSASVLCADCHSSASWSPMREDANFDHAEDTGFALLASHESVSCESCHVNLVFLDDAYAGGSCQGCHEDVHDGKLSTSCETCHNQQAFTEVDGFMIHQGTEFPLVGSHELIACESCHNDNHGGLFFGEEATCVSCHREEYDNTTILPHAEQGFSLDCETCHTQFVWFDAIFPEHAILANGFELIGAHEFAGCESCHTSPTFDLIFHPADQNDCYACHADDYADEHGNDGFPITCLDCHNQDNWDDTRRFNHDEPFFPIYSGTHQGTWDGCIDCHQSAPVMTTFTCITCHEHRKDKMDDEHDDVLGYIYDSVACLSCHPDGKEDEDD